MGERIDLTGKVAIVTGAGGGLGRAHALLLARRGARVVVNDLGGDLAGVGRSSEAAEKVAQEIRAAGGEALASGASVTEPDEVAAMVAQAVDRWGGVDILVNNAGILRDKTFAKMPLEDFRLVVEVHLMGAVICTRAVWNLMRERGYGRIVFTTSSSGLYGNFGQSNYGAAKMALVGLMQTLALEGAKAGIRVNCLAPTAGTRMLDGLMPAEALAALSPEAVSPAVLALVADSAPTRTILCAGAGGFEQAHITLTRGIHLADLDDAPEQLLGSLDQLADLEGMAIPASGAAQGALELAKAGHSLDAERRP
jgi:NAD(P)-dependent dehydrogenase (short-subunit alcohol dehydrogenase family)